MWLQSLDRPCGTMTMTCSVEEISDLLTLFNTEYSRRPRDLSPSQIAVWRRALSPYAPKMIRERAFQWCKTQSKAPSLDAFLKTFPAVKDIAPCRYQEEFDRIQRVNDKIYAHALSDNDTPWVVLLEMKKGMAQNEIELKRGGKYFHTLKPYQADKV